MRKLVISGGICGVLVLQGAVQIVDTGGTFWPFAPYHMYSDVYGAGSTITFHELRLSGGGEDGPAPFTFRHAGLDRYVYEGLLRAAAAGDDHPAATGPGGVSGYLGRLARGSGRHGPAELWTLSYRIEADGLASRDPERRLLREWVIGPEGEP